MMKKYLLLIFFFTFFLVGCGGGGSHGNPVNDPPPQESSSIVCPDSVNCSSIPTVSMLTPSNNATSVTLSPIIQLQFNESVINVNSTTVQLHQGSESGVVIAISQIVAGDNNTYTFSPQFALQPDTQYYVTLSDGISGSGVRGIALSPTTFTFTTVSIASGSVAPTVALVTPGNGATNIPFSPSIQLQFSMPVENVNSTTVELHQGDESGVVVAISQITAGDNNTYTFSPQLALQANTPYYITLSNGITNLNAVSLVPTFFYFTTMAESGPPGNETPTVRIITPSNNATNVTLNPSIQLQFSMAVQHVNRTNVTLHEGSLNGPVVAINEIVAGDNNTYTFSPVFLLNQTTKYYVELNDNITNDAGIALATSSFSFTTGNFAIPMASMVSPINNATGVSTYPSIQLKFSTQVLNVNTSTISIRQGTVYGPSVPIGSITPDANNVYTLTGITLNEYTKYYIVLSNNITSVAGVSLVPTTFSFTTGANITLTGPGGTQYVANKEQMDFTNNSGSALTISSISVNAAIEVLIYPQSDTCTNKIIPNHSSCSYTVNISQYYSNPTLVTFTVQYTNGSSNSFPIYISYLAFE